MASRPHHDYLLVLLATPLALWTGCGDDKSSSSGSDSGSSGSSTTTTSGSSSSSTTTTLCVAAGTLVATPRGLVAIEALRVGDPIFAVDLERGMLLSTEVVSLRHARRECLALVADDGRELVVTPDHPVHVPEVGGYVEAGRVALRQAASLTMIDGAPAEARVRPHAVGEHRLYAGVHDVFDVGVASEHHNFIAGGFVVHNKITTCPSGSCETTGTTTDGGTTTGGDTESGTDSGAPTTSATGSSGDATTGASTGTTTGGPATFPCGEEADCVIGGEYCEIFHPGQPEGMITHTCMPLPEACLDMPDCTCLDEQGVFGSCMPGPEGGLTVSIFAP